jgi:hypothetical protein
MKAATPIAAKITTMTISIAKNMERLVIVRTVLSVAE